MVDDKCSDGNKPDEHIVMETTHLAFLKDDADAYITDDTKVEVIDSFSGPMMEAQANVAVTDDTGSESTHAFVAQGAWVGDVDTGLYFGYVGTASYILQTGELNYKTNDFIIDDTVVEDVCIVEVDADGNCVGDAKVATPGTYKYSLYGYTDGSMYNIFAAEFAYVGFR